MKRTITLTLIAYWLTIIVITISLATAGASAQEPLKQDNTLTEQQEVKSGWFDLATVGDAVTTIVGLGCSTVKELNPILKGANPVGVAGFFVVRNVLYHRLTASIPSEFRDVWLNTTIGAQTLVVLNNVAVIAKYC